MISVRLGKKFKKSEVLRQSKMPSQWKYICIEGNEPLRLEITGEFAAPRPLFFFLPMPAHFRPCFMHNCITNTFLWFCSVYLMLSSKLILHLCIWSIRNSNLPHSIFCLSFDYRAIWYVKHSTICVWHPCVSTHLPCDASEPPATATIW